MSGTAAAGWYDDGTGRQRWWDGSTWTEHFVDLADPEVVLRTDQPERRPTAAGWYDDGRGHQRWWDGKQWTAHTQKGPDARECAGFVIDGRWIHFGELSLPVKDVTAVLAPVGEIRKRPSLRAAAANRMLFTAGGRLSPGRVGKIDARALYIAVEGPQQLWLNPAPAAGEAEARQFISWVNASAEHYRYRD